MGGTAVEATITIVAVVTVVAEFHAALVAVTADVAVGGAVIETTVAVVTVVAVIALLGAALKTITADVSTGGAVIEATVAVVAVGAVITGLAHLRNAVATARRRFVYTHGRATVAVVVAAVVTLFGAAGKAVANRCLCGWCNRRGSRRTYRR